MDWFGQHGLVLLEGALGALIAWFHLRQEVAVMKSELKTMKDEIIRLRNNQHRTANKVTNMQLQKDIEDRGR